MRKLGAQRYETFIGWHEMQRMNAALVKTNGSKGSSSVEKVGDITSTI